jgi:hypothetical protein
MHDPKFEQEVQRRMHDLEFVPSESVWAGIRQGIAPRRRRRVAAVIWWLFPGMLVVAAGIVMYRHSATTGGVAAAVPAVGTGKVVTGRGKGSKVGETGSDGNGVVRAGNGNEGSGIVRAGNGNEGSRGVQMKARRADDAAGGGEAGTVSGEETTVGGEQGTAAAKRASRISMERYRPGLIRGLGLRRGVDGPPLEWQPVNTAVSGISRPRHPWAVGFAAGGGAASIYSPAAPALATVSSSNNSGAYTASAPNVSRVMGAAYPAGNGVAKQNKTYVQPGYSYWGGIYGEKQLSGRWSVDIGLNLHYYSVRFETNGEVSYAPSWASLFAATAVTYSTNSVNTSSGEGVQTYYNHYYFLEVPAAVQWRLNHNPRLPLFWRGGAVFSYLMSSNGLYYDNSTGNDEKDNGVVRHPQVSIQSGLMVGLPVRGIQIQAGPEVQYAPSSMLMAGSGGGHMVYGGMRVALMR